MGASTLYLVFSNPVDGMEQEFNEWYDNVHLREVLATPGMVSAQRYTVRETEMDRLLGTEPKHRYCVVYEMNDDPDIVMGKIQAAVEAGEIHMHEALDLSTFTMSYWSPYGPKLEH
jgi:hypothetical protein